MLISQYFEIAKVHVGLHEHEILGMQMGVYLGCLKARGECLVG